LKIQDSILSCIFNVTCGHYVLVSKYNIYYVKIEYTVQLCQTYKNYHKR